MEALGGVAEPNWKVLVYDKAGQDILSPALTVTQLRSLGVTLYLQVRALGVGRRRRRHR